MSQKRSSEGPLTPSKQAKLTAGIPVTLGLSGQVVATTDAGLSPSAASLSPAPPTIPSLLGKPQEDSGEGVSKETLSSGNVTRRQSEATTETEGASHICIVLVAMMVSQ